MLSKLQEFFCRKAKKTKNVPASDQVNIIKPSQYRYPIVRGRDEAPDGDERRPRTVKLSTERASIISRSTRVKIPSSHYRGSSTIVPTSVIQETDSKSAANNKDETEPTAVPSVISTFQTDPLNASRKHKSHSHRAIDHVGVSSRTLNSMLTASEIHKPLEQLEPTSKHTAPTTTIPLTQSTITEIFRNPGASTSLLSLPIIEVAHQMPDSVDTFALSITSTPITVIRYSASLDPTSSLRKTVHDCADAPKHNIYEEAQAIPPADPNTQRQDDSFYYHSLKSRLAHAKDYCELMNQHKAADQDISSPEFDEEYLRFLARRFIQIFATTEQVIEFKIPQGQQDDQYGIAATDFDSPILADVLLTTTEGSHNINFQGSDLYENDTCLNDTVVENHEGASEAMAWLESLDLVQDTYVDPNTVFYDSTAQDLWNQRTEQELKNQAPAKERPTTGERGSLEAYDDELLHDRDSLYDYLLRATENPQPTHLDTLEHAAPCRRRSTVEELSPTTASCSEAIPLTVQAMETARPNRRHGWQKHVIDPSHEDFTPADEYRTAVDGLNSNQYEYSPLIQKATDTAESTIRNPCAVPASTSAVDEPPTWLLGSQTSNAASDELNQTFYSIIPESPPYGRTEKTFAKNSPDDEEDRQTVQYCSPGGGDNEPSREQLYDFLGTFRGALELMTHQRDAAVAKSTQIMKDNMALRRLQSEQTARLEQLDELFSQQREVSTKYTAIIERQIVEINQLNAKLSAMDYREGIAQIQMKEMARLQLQMRSSHARSDVFRTDDVFVAEDEDFSDESIFF